MDKIDDFQFPDAEFVQLDDVQMAVYRAGPDWRTAEKPPVVLMHGFPELAYSWRYQMAALAQAGYPVLVPDMLGYGQSDKPADVNRYRTQRMAQDMGRLLDHYGMQKAVFIGHDWGALLLWMLPFVIADRVLGYGGLNVGYVHDYPADPIELMRARFGDDMYIVSFQSAGQADAYLNSHVEMTLRYFFRQSGGRSPAPPVKSHEKNLELIKAMACPMEDWGGVPLMADADFNVYKQAFTQGGFEGPLHWYRNLSQNWHDKRKLLAAGGRVPISSPCLMITADKDHACPPYLADGMPEYWSNLTRHDLVNCGHWSMQEKTQEVNDTLLTWLDQNF